MGCAVINYARPAADARAVYLWALRAAECDCTHTSLEGMQKNNRYSHSQTPQKGAPNKQTQLDFKENIFSESPEDDFGLAVFIVINSGEGIFLSVELMRPLRVRQPRQIVSLSATVLRVAHTKKVSGLPGRFIGLCAGGAMNVFACAAFSVGQTSGACELPSSCAETIPRTHAASQG